MPAPFHSPLRLASFFGLALFLCAGPALGWAGPDRSSRCPRATPPHISVKTVLADPAISHSSTLADIRDMAEKGGPKKTSGSAHEAPVGLTEASLILGNRYEVLAQEDPETGMVCAQIARVDFTFGFDDATIYVAHEIPRYSCGFEEVLAHEKRHVEMDRLFVEQQSPKLPTFLDHTVSSIGMVLASSAEDAQAYIAKQMGQSIDKMGENLSRLRAALQAQIDTKEEYERISKACDGQLGKYIN